eukprot:TRINITY_DN20667_c0_g1_i1.p1 TRINITY_DN20667_c0_g1~~TRINITY_DN20667_c0_g1_i1.p1  ORF type:complete len:107 (-),score=11.56 TRINITY_DN20667_c0_g1_i1:129-449(-)
MDAYPQLTTAASAISRCVRVDNMFALKEMKGDFEQELLQDLSYEISKMGIISGIKTDKESCAIYIQAESPATAQKINHNLNGRFFAGRKLSSRYVSVSDFDSVLAS